MIRSERYTVSERTHRPQITAAMLYGLAAVLLVIALALPWWNFFMVAPQYPEGLNVTTWFFTVTGDVHEVDELNHYIGFMPLAQMASFERNLAHLAGPLFVLLLAIAAFVKTRWRALLAIPAITLPVVFLVDLAVWLQYAGHHLDPHAALSGAVQPWSPNLFGPGGVGQFHTYSSLQAGFYLAVLAAIVSIVAVFRQFKEQRTA